MIVILWCIDFTPKVIKILVRDFYLLSMEYVCRYEEEDDDHYYHNDVTMRQMQK